MMGWRSEILTGTIPSHSIGLAKDDYELGLPEKPSYERANHVGGPNVCNTPLHSMLFQGATLR